MKLSSDHAKYIRKLWTDLREANQKVRKFDEEWQGINEALNLRYAGQDPVQIDHKKGENLALRDALAAGNWWRDKAIWLSGAILAEKAAAEMLNGDGSGWQKADGAPMGPAWSSRRI